MSILNSGWVGMLPFIVGIMVTLYGGWVSDRLVGRGMRITVVRKALTVSGLFAAAVFTLLAAYTSGLWLAITFLTLAIAGFSFSTASLSSMAVDVAPPHIVSSLVSLQNFGGNVGGSFAPIVTGLLISASGDFRVALLVTAGVSLISCFGYGVVVGNLDDTLKERSASAPA